MPDRRVFDPPGLIRVHSFFFPFQPLPSIKKEFLFFSRIFLHCSFLGFYLFFFFFLFALTWRLLLLLLIFCHPFHLLLRLYRAKNSLPMMMPLLSLSLSRIPVTSIIIYIWIKLPHARRDNFILFSLPLFFYFFYFLISFHSLDIVFGIDSRIWARK